jgi:hypothetical protein
MVTISCKAQTPLTANDHHTIATITTHIHKYYLSHKAQNPLRENGDHPNNITYYIGT